MNAAHLHLAINHVPVILFPTGLLFLLLATLKKNHTLQRASLWMLTIAGLSALPAFLSGEPAEEIIEKLPGFLESTIEGHEEIAKIAFILSLLTGAFTGFLAKKNSIQKPLLLVALGLAVATTALLGYTAYLGGHIRHTELWPESQSIQQSTPDGSESQDSQ